MSDAGKPGAGAQKDWEKAYRWLYQRRQHAPANADVWDLRFKWPKQKSQWFNTVIAGEYRLSPMQVFHRGTRHWVQCSAHDALVLKWIAERVTGQLPLNQRCYHLKGYGVVVGAINRSPGRITAESGVMFPHGYPRLLSPHN